MKDSRTELQTEKAEKLKKAEKRITWKNVLFLQLIVIVFTFSGVAAKFASGHPFFSSGFILFFGIQIAILGVYAILWQQIIKWFDLSVAYANRAMAILWSMLWAAVFFRENISVQNVIGVLIVLVGTIVINTERKAEHYETDSGFGKSVKK